MTETKSPRNDFVSVLCKHDANCNIRAGLTVRPGFTQTAGYNLCAIHLKIQVVASMVKRSESTTRVKTMDNFVS